jgi:hypothetical protein
MALKAIFNFIFLILLSGFIASCSTKEISGLNVSGEKVSEFYPIQKGNVWYYKVDSTHYSRLAADQDLLRFDSTYYLKEQIADSIGLQDGSPWFRVERYKSRNSTGPWFIDSVWSIQRGTDKIVKTENNRPIIKLKGPLGEGIRWDGNQYNSLGNNSGNSWFTVKEFNKEIIFNNNAIASLLVIQKADSNCFSKENMEERYLKGIGPSYIRKSSLSYFRNEFGQCGTIPIIESGTERIFTLYRFEKDQ